MASRSWNRVELIGNLTRDPELRYTPNGAAVVTFGVATNRTYVSEGERKEEVDFHRLVAWNKLAELCNQLLKKGHRVFVSGRLQTRSWEGNDGQQRQTTEIVLEDMILLTPKNIGEPSSSEEFNQNELPNRQVSPVIPNVEEKPAEKVEVEPKEKEEKEEDKKTPSENPPQEEIGADEDLPF